MAKSPEDLATDTSNIGNVETDAPKHASDAGASKPADPKEPAGQAEATEDEALEADAVELIDGKATAEDDDGGSDKEKDTPSDSEIVEAAKAEVAEWKDKYMRLHAEWDTYRRRTNEQRKLEKERANEKLVTSLIPVLDDFERTIEYASDNGESGLLEGVEAVHAKLMSTLEKDGVETIDPTGEAFDAIEAQAVGTIEDSSVPDETVSQVYQKGYRMGDKVLRPAMVTVTSGGPKRKKKKDEKEEE